MLTLVFHLPEHLFSDDPTSFRVLSNPSGGRYDKGVITGTYNAGQIMDTVIHMNANHRGHVEFDLCAQPTENNTCFTHRLTVVSGDRPITAGTAGRAGNRICSGGDHQNGDFRARVQLPANVRCTRCTLRMTYRTSYPPAPNACWQPNPTQTFRNCVDIRIN